MCIRKKVKPKDDELGAFSFMLLSFRVRIRSKVTLWPNMSQAGNYSCTLHYLRAVASMGATAAKADGAASVARMKAIPTDDGCFGSGRVRGDGRKSQPAYLFEVK
jgi:branched-chain amino acid transport system substrate-binding protein